MATTTEYDTDMLMNGPVCSDLADVDREIMLLASLSDDAEKYRALKSAYDALKEDYDALKEDYDARKERQDSVARAWLPAKALCAILDNLRDALEEEP